MANERLESTSQDLCGLFTHSGFFVLRTALLPFDDLARWNDELPALVSDEGITRHAHHHRRAALIAGLARAFQASELREAILFSSPRLEAKLDGWLPGQQLDHVLARYFSRMCSRPTPFGIFAGVSFGAIADVSRLHLGARSSYRRHTRPSMGFLSKVLANATAHVEERAPVRYEPTSSLYWALGRYSFSRHGADGQSHPVVEIEASPYLEIALATATRGATLEEIAAALESLAMERETGLAYARALVEHAVLVPCWLPAVTGHEPFEAAGRALAEHASLRAIADLIGSACERLCALDQVSVGGDVGALRDVAHALEEAGETLGYRSSTVLQADLMKPVPDLSLGTALVERMLNAARLIHRTGWSPPDSTLAQFRERFIDRYGTRWVPLVDALDGELGLGYGGHEQSTTDALLHDLAFDKQPSVERRVSPLDELRLEVLTAALQRGGLQYTLDPQLLARFPGRELDPLPESFAVVAQLATREGQVQIVEPYLIAPSGVVAAARFCHADAALEKAVRAHVELEQASAGVRLLVDVAHLPDGDVGNILLRPALRAGEIVYAGKSGADRHRQIPIKDLYVSVFGEEVRLYSRRLGKRVSIRITNALDHHAWQNLPIYRFLGALQEHDRRSLPSGWSWGMLESSSFVPRVVCEDVVLSRARWLIRGDELTVLEVLAPAQAFEFIRALRERLRLPRWVALSAGETALVIDLDNVLSVELLVREARRAARIALQEVLPTPDDLVIAGPEGKFVGEIILPFVRNAKDGIQREARPGWVPHFDAKEPASRSFGPGSEWLYAKIYAGQSVLERIVQQVALEVVPSLPSEAMSLWFFVPYADPEPHLRLRFRGEPKALLDCVLPELGRVLAPLRQTGAVHRVQLDTYEREVERYGGMEGIELAERAFACDSDAVARLLGLCKGNAELRWQFTMLGIDRSLADFGLNLEQRAAAAAVAMEGYRREFRVSAAAVKGIAAKYRNVAERLTTVLWPKDAGFVGGQDENPIARAHDIYRERSVRLIDVVQRFGAEGGSLRVDRSEWIHSMAHMHAIRMLGPRARSHELVIYDFLRRQYASRLARRPRESDAKGV